MNLLDRYVSRFGRAVRRQGNGWNGPCPLCGGEPGKSDRFMVWPERSEKLGDVCAKHGIAGIWSCRQCGESGDTIAYLMKVDGHDFKSALGELGIEPQRQTFRRRRAPEEPVAVGQARAWEPKELPAPSEQWQERAMRLVEKAAEKIWNSPQAIAWLNARGICEEAIRAYRLGYLEEESAKYHGSFRPRASFGLVPKAGRDGKTHDKIFIPRGIVIPSFSATGEIMNIRIRRHKSDLLERAPKYLELEGSCHGPLFLSSSQPRQFAVYFITEAELDAMLIHHASGGVAGAVAVRTNRGKPDTGCHAVLKEAVRICVALDYDSAGAEGCDFWEQTYSSSMRWPTPEGKDPGDAYALGVDIREWVAAGLPGCVKLPENSPQLHRSSISQNKATAQSNPENGHADPSAPGLENLGDGGQATTKESSGSWPSQARARVELRAMAEDYPMESTRWNETQPKPFPWASKADFAAPEVAMLEGSLPKGTALDDIYLDVAVVWLAWRNLPVNFYWRKDESGAVDGFHWDIDHEWERKNSATFEKFWRLQSTSRAFWAWIADHPAPRINAGNLLRLWELIAKQN